MRVWAAMAAWCLAVLLTMAWIVQALSRPDDES